jgi:hypothetical protein
MTERLDDGTLQAIKEAGLESQTVQYLAATKEGGYKLLNRLSRTDSDAPKALLDIEDAATQRRFRQAFRRGDLNAEELSRALSRYDAMGADGRRAYDDLLASTGDDGASFVAKLDTERAKEFLGDVCRGATSSVSAVPGSAGAGLPGSVAPVVQAGCSDSLPPEAENRYRQTVVEAASESDDISATTILDQVDSLGVPKERVRLKQLFTDTGEDGIRFVRELDSDRQQKLFSIDDRVREGKLNTRDWRNVLASYQQRSQITTSEINTHIDNAYELATDERVENPEGLLDELTGLPTEGRLGTGQFRRYDNELERTKAYANDPDVGEGQAETIKVEPDFESTDRDVDIRIEYQDGTKRWVEFKRLDRAAEPDNMIDNVFKTEADKSTVNEKFRQIGDEVPTNGNARVGDVKIKYSSDGFANEDEVREVVEQIAQDQRGTEFEKLHFDQLRVVPKNGDTFTIDISQYRSGP